MSFAQEISSIFGNGIAVRVNVIRNNYTQQTHICKCWRWKNGSELSKLDIEMYDILARLQFNLHNKYRKQPLTEPQIGIS